MVNKDFIKRIKEMKDREKEIHEFIYSYFPNETTGKGRWSEIYSVMKFLYNKHQQIKSYISPQINRAVKNKSYFYNCYGKEEKFYIENQG